LHHVLIVPLQTSSPLSFVLVQLSWGRFNTEQSLIFNGWCSQLFDDSFSDELNKNVSEIFKFCETFSLYFPVIVARCYWAHMRGIRSVLDYTGQQIFTDVMLLRR